MYLPMMQGGGTGMGISEVLGWLQAGGALVVAGWFVSWYLEKQGWWQRLGSETKSLAMLGLAVGIGLGALGVSSLGPDLLGRVKPALDLVVLTMGGWLATQVAHRANGEKSRGEG